MTTGATRARAQEAERAAAKAVFLKELARRANVSAAAKKAKIHRATAYTWYQDDAEFAASWDSALETAVDSLEAEAWRRAHTGVLEPVFQKGEQVGRIRKYSDTLMITLLKAHRPDKFRERSSTELTGPGGAPLETAAPIVNVYLPDNTRNDRTDDE